MLSFVYMPKKNPALPGDLIGFLVYNVKKKKCHLVMDCDAHVHHNQWQSYDMENNGESILDFIILNKLKICNVDTMPIFLNRVKVPIDDIALFNVDKSKTRVFEFRKTVPVQVRI